MLTASFKYLKCAGHMLIIEVIITIFKRYIHLNRIKLRKLFVYMIILDDVI